MTPTHTWRLIEAELVEWMRSQGYFPDENIDSGDKLMWADDTNPINLTSLAHHLAQSFVPRTVTVKA